jgi:hypothetical protein
MFPDSALVRLTAFSRFVGSDSAVFMTFDRYTYRASRMSPLAWRVTARYLETTGVYEFPRPPSKHFPAR